MQINQFEVNVRSEHGKTFASAKINPNHTARFIDYLRERLANPFLITINAGVWEDDQTPYDFIELDSESSGEPGIHSIFVGFRV